MGDDRLQPRWRFGRRRPAAPARRGSTRSGDRRRRFRRRAPIGIGAHRGPRCFGRGRGERTGAEAGEAPVEPALWRGLPVESPEGPRAPIPASSRVARKAASADRAAEPAVRSTAAAPAEPTVEVWRQGRRHHEGGHARHGRGRGKARGRPRQGERPPGERPARARRHRASGRPRPRGGRAALATVGRGQERPAPGGWARPGDHPPRPATGATTRPARPAPGGPPEGASPRSPFAKTAACRAEPAGGPPTSSPIRIRRSPSSAPVKAQPRSAHKP